MFLLESSFEPFFAGSRESRETHVRSLEGRIDYLRRKKLSRGADNRIESRRRNRGPDGRRVCVRCRARKSTGKLAVGPGHQASNHDRLSCRISRARGRLTKTWIARGMTFGEGSIIWSAGMAGGRVFVGIMGRGVFNGVFVLFRQEMSYMLEIEGPLLSLTTGSEDI